MLYTPWSDLRSLTEASQVTSINKSTGNEALNCSHKACSDTLLNKSSEEITDLLVARSGTTLNKSPDNLRQNLSTKLDIAASKQAEKSWSDVPEYVKSYKDVFEKENFDKLPNRKPWDHAIELVPGNHQVRSKIYPLNQGEQSELDAFLKENLDSGRMRPSKSPFASPFFFIQKKDGKLRPLQDYRKLNEVTRKNR